MKGSEIFRKFVTLFPEYAGAIARYTKIGSKAIKLEYTGANGEALKPLIFMYKGEDDWTFGTRVWRRKPVKKA